MHHVVGAALAALILGALAAGGVVLSQLAPRVIVDARPQSAPDADVSPAAAAPVVYPKTFSIGSGATTALQYATGSVHAFGVCTNETTGVAVYVLNPSATATTDAGGPYCDTCKGGARFVIGTASARTSSGTASVRCEFYSQGLGGIAAVGLAAGGGGTGTLTGTGADNQCAFWSGATSLDGSASCTFDGTTFNLDGVHDIDTGTQATGATPLYDVTGTLASNVAATGYKWTATGAGTAGNFGSWIELAAGYTGSGAPVALVTANYSAGTGTALGTSGAGNFGSQNYSLATTTGTNIGQHGVAQGGNVNVGAVGRSTGTKTNSTNVGVGGQAATNVGVDITTAGVLGWVSTSSHQEPDYASGAVVASNTNSTFPLFVAMDGATSAWSVIDGGHMQGTQVASGAPQWWRLPGAIGATSTPITCAASGDEGKIYYVRDTDSGAGTQCLCLYDGAAYALKRSIDETTACPDP
jgi:hypothetical protein